MAYAEAKVVDPQIRLGMVGGGVGAFIGAVHWMAARLDGHFELVARALSSTPEKAMESERGARAGPDTHLCQLQGNGDPGSAAERRYRGGIDCYPEPRAFRRGQGIPTVEKLPQVQHAGFQGRGSGLLLQIGYECFGWRPVSRALSGLVVEDACDLVQGCLRDLAEVGVRRQKAADALVGVFDGAFLPGRTWITEPASCTDTIFQSPESHKGKQARDAIRDVGAHLFFLPPYSPDLNPIEMMFAKIKTLVRKAEERTVETTWRRIGEILTVFSLQECSNYRRHAGYGSV